MRSPRFRGSSKNAVTSQRDARTVWILLSTCLVDMSRQEVHTARYSRCHAMRAAGEGLKNRTLTRNGPVRNLIRRHAPCSSRIARFPAHKVPRRNHPKTSKKTCRRCIEATLVSPRHNSSRVPRRPHSDRNHDSPHRCPPRTPQNSLPRSIGRTSRKSVRIDRQENSSLCRLFSPLSQRSRRRRPQSLESPAGKSALPNIFFA